MQDIVGFITNTGGQATDIAVGYSDNEHIEDLTMFCKGWQKFEPQYGAEAGRDIKTGSLNRLKTEVSRNLKADGAKGVDVWIENDKININAEYP